MSNQIRTIRLDYYVCLRSRLNERVSGSVTDPETLSALIDLSKTSWTWSVKMLFKISQDALQVWELTLRSQLVSGHGSRTSYTQTQCAPFFSPFFPGLSLHKRGKCQNGMAWDSREQGAVRRGECPSRVWDFVRRPCGPGFRKKISANWRPIASPFRWGFSKGVSGGRYVLGNKITVADIDQDFEVVRAPSDSSTHWGTEDRSHQVPDSCKLYQANSCPPEHPLSMFNASYDDDQRKDHTDYIELSMQSQYNKRIVRL